MHSDPQISLHAIALRFNSSRDTKIQRLCPESFRGSISAKLDSTRLGTDQFIRAELPDKTLRIVQYWKKIGPLSSVSFLDNPRFAVDHCVFSTNKAMRGRIALQKHFVQIMRMPVRFRASFRSAQGSSRRSMFNNARITYGGIFTMKLIRWLGLVCVVLLIVYGASPYFSFWRFTVAVRSGDSAAINARVDFPAVRASLKKQLVARFVHATSGQKRWANLGPTLIDVIIETYATPDGIADLISNPGALKNLQNLRQFQFSSGKPED
jgi:hypothetical protein